MFSVGVMRSTQAKVCRCELNMWGRSRCLLPDLLGRWTLKPLRQLTGHPMRPADGRNWRKADIGSASRLRQLTN